MANIGLSIEERNQAIQAADWFMSQLTDEQQKHISMMIPADHVRELCILKIAEICSRRGLNYILRCDSLEVLLGEDSFDFNVDPLSYDPYRNLIR